jgi:hypothetical protein
MRFMLVHSPLVGPATWRWVADALGSVGHEAILPDLTAAAATGDPHAVIEAARSSVRTDACIVGHSGAGFLLPAIAAGPDSGTRSCVFVDAGMPPCEGEGTPSADFLGRLRELAVDGALPRWSTWWGPGAMEQLIPDQVRREEVEAELPEVPLAFYERSVVAPAGWCDRPAGYLLLSEAYRQDADVAVGRGWPVVERLGAHLDIVNDPEGIAHDLLELVRGCSGDAGGRVVGPGEDLEPRPEA